MSIFPKVGVSTPLHLCQKCYEGRCWFIRVSCAHVPKKFSDRLFSSHVVSGILCDTCRKGLIEKLMPKGISRTASYLLKIH